MLAAGIVLTVLAAAVAGRIAGMAAALICAGLGLVLLVLAGVYTRRRYQRLYELNNYLALVCSGRYDLDICSNTEGELSILSNNLYKVITLLRTQNDLLAQDKVRLADSLADISHQLKTPLTSMMMMTDLLREETDPEKQTEFIEVMETQLGRMRWLILNLLKLSKLDAGTIELKCEKKTLRSTLQEAMQPFLVMMELREITLLDQTEDFSYKGDQHWTAEAIGNIIKNCIEHMEKGGHLTLRTARTHIYDSLYITDDGCGIAPKDLPHIFERFYQGSSPSGESVGIGLALSKAILEKERASIRAESTEGKGTTFELRFYKALV